jgi:surface polysaccharide O-acyltransferase-like enzyme
MQRKNKDLFWLNDTRLLAASAIIFVHFVQNVQSTLHSGVGSLSWWETNFYLAFTMWGVPVFVMISGAILLSPHKEYRSATEFYAKRLNRLGIPILFWTIFYLGITYAKSLFLGHSFDLKEIGIELIGGRPYNHMWYLYMVFGLYLFTPFLRKISKYSDDKEVKTLVSLLMIISFLAVLTKDITLHNSTIFIFMFPVYLSYFFAGHLIMRTTIHLKTYHLIFLIILFGVLTALGQYGYEQYHWKFSFHHNFSITMIPLSICIMILIKKIHKKIAISEKLRETLAKFTLGAYLIHPVIVGVIVQIGYFGMDMHSYTAIKIFLITVLIIFVSVVIAYIFSKIPFLKRVI